MDTTALMSLEARPVAVMQPAMMPAMQHATATVMVPLPPASRASNILAGVMRLPLSKRLTTMATRIATVAENCMVRVLVVTSHTSTTSGSSRYIFLMSLLITGSSSLGMPLRRSFFASR